MKGKKGQNQKSKTINKRQTNHIYGCLAGIDVGHSWQTRQELSTSWVHRPKSASLHAGTDGVFSLLINSKYRGEDKGVTIYYSGHKIKGKRNHSICIDSLLKNYKNQTPIRVIRGAKRNSVFAPSTGFRYDGLYGVEKYSKEKDHLCFCLRRLLEQNVAPWIIPLPKRNETVSSTSKNDKDISPYVSFIRCQSRPTNKQIKEELNQNNSKTSSNEIESPNESSVLWTSVSSEDSVNHIPAKSLQVNSQVNKETEVHQINEQFEIPDSPTDEPVRLLRGMPIPKIPDLKEEVLTSNCHVVIEKLPEQDVYEVYKESVIYEEQQTEFTVFSKEDITEVNESDDDCWEVEEEEIDSEFIRDVANTQIVTALSLSQTNPLTQMPKLGITFDIEVEDGPKFAQFISRNANGHNSMYTDFANSNPTNYIFNTNQTLSPQNFIKTDCVDEGEELIQPGTSGIEPDEDIVDADDNCLIICPGTKCENDEEIEQAILNDNFQLVQGSIQDPTEIPGYSLHEFQEMTIRSSQQEINKNVANNEDSIQENIYDVDPFSCQQMCVSEKPDSSSEMATDHLTNHYHQGNQCPCKDLTIRDLVAYTLSEPNADCVCNLLKRLPSMNYCIQEILKAKRAGNLSVHDKERKRILPSEQSNQIAKIDQVYTMPSNDWISSEQLDETRSPQETIIVEEISSPNNDNEEMGNPQRELEVLTSNRNIMQTNVPQPMLFNNQNDPKLNAIKQIEISWRGLEEVRDEAMKRICSMPQPIVSDQNDILKAVEDRPQDEAKSSEDVEEKVSRLPCYYSERKEVVVHQSRKRKLSNLNLEGERSNSPATQEVSHPTNKLRMLQVRNIRAEINRTRIVQVNGNMCSSESPPLKETTNDDPENIQENQDIIVQQVNKDETNSSNSAANGEFNFSFPIVSEETNIQSVCERGITPEIVSDELCEDLPKRMPREENITVKTPSTPNSTNDVVQPIVRKRGRRPTPMEKDVSSTSPTVSDDSPLSSPLVHEKKYVIAQSDSPKETCRAAALPVKVSSSSSDSSDTTIFERACIGLCEDVRKNEDYAVPSPASLKKPVGKVDSTVNVKKRRRRLDQRRPNRPSSEKILKKKQYSTNNSTSLKKKDEELNCAPHFKGFTRGDVIQMRKKKDIVERVKRKIISDLLLGSRRKKESCTKPRRRRLKNRRYF